MPNAFVHGKAARVYCDGYDMTTYLNDVKIAAQGDTVETSTLGASWKSYIAGLADGTINVQGYYDGSTVARRAMLEATLGANGLGIGGNAGVGGSLHEWTVLPVGDAIGATAMLLAATHSQWESEVAVNSVISVAGQGQASTAIEFGASLHVLAAETAVGNYSPVDFGAVGSPTLLGAAAYLQVSGGTFTNAVVKVQHSLDNISYVDLAVFPAVTSGASPSSQRVAVSGTVNRYVRAALTTLTGSTITFNVAYSRK